MKLKTVSQSLRWPFVVLTPACLVLGWSLAFAGQSTFDIHLFVLSLLGALFAHISVNTINEYYDFTSGLDLITQRTRFSGGSGALPAHPDMANAVLTIGLLCLLATSLVGLFFVWKYGWAIIPLGIAGLLLITTYTGWINQRPILCLIAPGLGFGVLMVAGANFALTGTYSSSTWLISLVPFFLVNNLLLLNQYPDIVADRSVGRKHLPITYGIPLSNLIYGVFIMLTVSVIISALVADIIPPLSLIALVPMPLAFYALYGAIKHGASIGDHPRYLGSNVAVALLSPTLLGLAIMTGTR